MTDGDPWRRLAVAIIKRGVLDAKSANGCAAEARRWLLSSDWAYYLYDALDLDAGRVRALPELSQPGLEI